MTPIEDLWDIPEERSPRADIEAMAKMCRESAGKIDHVPEKLTLAEEEALTKWFKE